MGQLTNLYVSESYQGLIKLADSTTGVTGTLQYTQDGVGNNLPIQISTSSVNITGSFTVNGQPISVDSGSLVTTASFNAFTASIDGRVDALELATGSLQSQINGLATTSSLTSLSSSIAVTDLAQNNAIAGLATTGSLSGYTTNTTFNNYTSSNDIKVNDLISKTGSYASQTGVTALSSSIAATDLGQNNIIAGLATTSSLTSLSSSIATTDLNQNNVIAGLATTSSLTSLSSSIASTDLGQDNRLGSLENKTGSYATTGSNSFIGNQGIFGDVSITGSLTAYSASITYLETVYQTSSVIFSSGSNVLGDEALDVQILWGKVELPTGPLSVTGSVTATNFTGSLEGTASYATQALSASYAPMPDVSGFATTGSNIFIGNQTISGSLLVSGSEVVTGPLTASRLQINGVTDLNGVLDVSNDATFRGDLYVQQSTNPKIRLRDTAGGGHSDGFDIQISTSSFVLTDKSHDFNFLEFDYNSGTTDHTLKLKANRFELNSGSLGVSGSLTASLQEGYVWVGGTGNISTAVATSSMSVASSSYATQALSASYAPDNSNRNGLITTGSAAGTQAITGSLILSGSAGPELIVIGDTIITGSVILSGSAGVELDVKGDQTITGSLYNKGDVYIINPSQSLGFNNISSSVSYSNIIFGWAGAPGLLESVHTGSVVISGSNNILMQGKPLRILNGYYNYVGGNQNIFGSYGVLLSTGSLLRPVVAGNIVPQAGQIIANFTTSSLAGGEPAISINYVPNTVNIQHQSSSLTLSANIVPGTLNSFASQSVATLRPSITSNYVAGTINLIHASSSIGIFAQNIINGFNTNVSNLFSNTGSANQITLSRSNINGTNNGIFVSGTPNTNVSRSFLDVFIGGNTNAATSSYVGSDSANLHATMIYGQNLIVSASHAANVGGSSFFGRYNDVATGLNNSQNIVFAVGTGTAVGSRRTGLYVTSGSLVGVSGSLDVKGGTTLTGSVQGNVLPLTVVSNTASLDLNNGNFFELALTGSSDIRINPSNIKPGQTINIKLNTTGSGTVSFPTSVKQPSGSAYVPTTAVGTDIITMVSFDTTNLFVANVKNLI